MQVVKQGLKQWLRIATAAPKLRFNGL